MAKIIRASTAREESVRSELHKEKIDIDNQAIELNHMIVEATKQGSFSIDINEEKLLKENEQLLKESGYELTKSIKGFVTVSWRYAPLLVRRRLY